MNNLPKLGKLAPRHDRRTLKLANYLPIPAFPEERKWSEKVKNYGMMRNDKIGCCAVAGPAHMIQAWTANASKETIISDEDVVKIYSKLSGYNPVTGENDNGLVLLDVLKEWRNVGFCGHKIGAFAQVNHRNISEIKAAINLFGGTLNGIGLPVSAQKQVIWDTPSNGAIGDGAKYSWGGHCTTSPDYNGSVNTHITWGKKVNATWNFMVTYADEIWAIISPDFLNQNRAPNGFDLNQLLIDLAKF